METKHKVALVTGAGRGIGRAIALELARKGFAVAVNDLHAEGPAESVAEEVRSFGVPAAAFGADVSDPASVKEMFKAIKKELGGVSVLINNAGITRDNLLMRMKEDDWNAVISINLSSVFNCTKEAIRGMAKAQWGRIISLSSVVALIGNPGQANYTAAKAGIIGFTKTIAREYGSRGITANAVAPGFIESEMTAVLPTEVRESMLNQVALGRPGTPEDVARVVAFLASEEAGYVSGQVLAVDGGMTMC